MSVSRKQFNEYVFSPEKLSKASLQDLESLSSEFPYCQAGKLLYLLNLLNVNDIHFEKQLKVASASLPDRSKLKELVEKVNTADKPVEKETTPEKAERKDDFAGIDKLKRIELIEKAEKRLAEIHAELVNHTKTIGPEITSEEEPEKISPFEEIQKLSDISDARIQIPDATPDEKQKEGISDKKSDLTDRELIEKFIREKPRITPKSGFFDPADYARKSIVDNEEIISETLATIYQKQGKIKKAIKIYQKLSLKYPEKSRYFAARISKLENELNKPK